MNQVEVKLTAGKVVVIRELSALELMQATSYGGESPSNILIGQMTAVSSVCKLDGEEVFPLRSRPDFNAVAKRLSGDDLMLLGLAQMSLTQLSDDQKKDMEAAAAAVKSGEPLPTPASPASPGS